MRAVVYRGPGRVVVEEVPDPTLRDPRDAIVRVTSTAICGSDLHMYEGHTTMPEGRVLGHEPMGVVEAVGADVALIKTGDRVVMPFNIACGDCENCVRGFYNACLTVNPQGVGAGYGYAGLGPFHGGQAERLLVPYADFNCLKLPGTPHDEWEDDFVLLADVLPTGFQANRLAQVSPGKTVAIFGAGPVGLMATISAVSLLGASEVYVVDRAPARLAKAAHFGATTIDFTAGDPVAQIRERRQANAVRQQEQRPGEAKMAGVMCGIDAVGYQAFDDRDPPRERPNQVLENLIRLVNPTGAIGVIGVYMPEDPRGPTDEARQGQLPLSFGTLWEKSLAMGTGQAIVKRHQFFLRDLIVAGRVRPSAIVTQRLPLSEAPAAYREFDKRNGWIKVILKPSA